MPRPQTHANYAGHSQAYPQHVPRSTASAHQRQQPFKDPMPAAMQPNYVAERSNQIWSDVASQKSQDLRSFDPRGAP